MEPKTQPTAPPETEADKKPKHLIYVDVLETDEPLQTNQRVKRVACLFSNGDRVVGKKAETMRHPKHRISAKKQDQLCWEASSPFLVKIDATAADAFVEPQPWLSHRRKDGIHFVLSGSIRVDDPRLVARKEIEGKYTIIARANEVDATPKPGVEELDPHFIIDP